MPKQEAKNSRSSSPSNPESSLGSKEGSTPEPSNVGKKGKGFPSNLSHGTGMGKRGNSHFIRAKSGKLLTGRYAWRKHKVFKKYLDSLTTADKFISEQGLHALEVMGPRRRQKVMERLHLIDPEGFKKIQTLNHKTNKRKRVEKTRKLDQLQKIAIENELVAVAQACFEHEGVTTFRFVPAEGILATVAYLLAVGHSKIEVMEKLKLDPAIIKMVTPQMISEQKKSIGMATIIQAANQKVAFDMTTGDVTKATAIADKIATGRMKLMLDASKGTMGRKGLLPSEINEKVESHASRFGVTTDIKTVEEEEE